MRSDFSEDLPLYNSRVVDLFVQLIKTDYPQIDTGQVLAEVGIKPYEVADLGHWFTQEQVDLFVERLVQLTGNKNISRDAGRYAASPQAIGPMRQHVLGLISPAKAFSLIHKATRNFTRSVHYETRMLSENEVELVVTPGGGGAEKAHHCANRAGFLESIVNTFNVESPEIKHQTCVLKGDSSCHYLVSWKQPRSAHLAWVRNYVFPAFVLVNLGGLIFFPALVLTRLAPISVLLLLVMTRWVDSLEKKELRAGVKNLQESTENLVDQLNINYNNAQMAAEIGQAISTKTGVEGILEAVSQVLQDRLNFDRGVILLASEDRTLLNLKSAFGCSDELRNRMNMFCFHLDRPESKGVFVQAFHERKPLLISDIGEIEENLSPRSLAVMRETGTRSFISCPISCDGESIGILAVDNYKSNRPLTKGDMALLMGIAPIIGISIHNARLLEQRSTQFNSTLQVLSASIDARDFLTAGHSEKVTKYSVGICKALGLSAEETEMIRVAAMLHDYGKIGVPDFILKKDGPLTDDERAMVETHPNKTREILESINFEGVYSQIPQIAGSHHEKIDGSGYPEGLKGDEIPLGARIIAVADFFEAITAKRHYRGPMTVERALSLLRDGSGNHFDSSIVGAMINYVTQCKDFVLDEDDAKVKFFHRHVRVPCRSLVSCKAQKKTISGASSNLSLGGLFIAADNLVEPGDVIDVVFSLPKSPDRLIKAKGRVAWINPKDKVASLPTGFGIQFVDLSQEESSEIMDYVNHVFAA
ncbi:MAG TPA: HD domain-containing phosphohydrolase [Geopsychrobacteraceae bacterium]|nr:HD domain-containing phosphohydrolase [Geopsychrobacteraceae bacterium]